MPPVEEGISGIGADLSELAVGEDDSISSGSLRVLQELRQRPDCLWNISIGPEVGDRWRKLLKRLMVEDPALDYLAALALPEDIPLLDAILAEEEFPVVRELRAFLLDDPNPMAYGIANRNSQPTWQAEKIASVIETIDDDALGALAKGRHTPVELRRLAFRALQSREVVDQETLAALIAHPELVEELFEAVADPISPISAEAVASAVATFDPDNEHSDELSARARSITQTVEQLKEALSGDFDAIDAWEALGWTNDPSLVAKAREVFDTDGEPILQGVQKWKLESSTERFLRGRARLSALRILIGVSPVDTEDVERVRAEVRRNYGLTQEQAVVFLANAGTSQDVEELINRLPKFYWDSRGLVITRILELGGISSARQLLNTGMDEHRVLAVRWLGACPAVKGEELYELLYSSNQRVRMAALDEFMKRTNDAEAVSLLEKYPLRVEGYFYNVVVGLDWFLNVEKRSPQRMQLDNL
jgi:hypothetical protein